MVDVSLAFNVLMLDVMTKEGAKVSMLMLGGVSASPLLPAES
jgi:hypothetical protein